jgi:putative MFS transporter
VSAPAAPPRPRRPWWLLGPIPAGIQDGHIRILGFVAFAMLFENYDLGLMGAALPQIRESFGLSDAQAGSFMGAIELGGLFAFGIVPLADRFGRRRMLLACVVGMSLGSFLSAFAPNAPAFAACQVLMRSFASSAVVISYVIVAEEFPAEHRGWGIGMLGAIGALGFGLGALVYSQVERLPYGWRTVYALGGLAIALLPAFRRRIQETRRFQAHAASRGGAPQGGLGTALRPVLELARRYPGRAALLGLAAGLATVGHRPAFRFVSDFLQTEHGWSPGNFAAMLLVGGWLGIVGNVVAGRLGDRYGRRLVGAGMLAPFPLLAWLFFQGPASLVVAPWILMVFASMGSQVILRALAVELFPTSMRSSAGGWFLLVETLGAGIGLFLYAAMVGLVESWGLALSLVSLAAALGAVFLLFLPDTHRRELELISH